MSAVSGKSIAHRDVIELSWKFGPLQSQGNYSLFTDVQEWRNICVNHHFSPWCHNLLYGPYMVQRPKEYQISNEPNVCPTFQLGVFRGR